MLTASAASTVSQVSDVQLNNVYKGCVKVGGWVYVHVHMISRAMCSLYGRKVDKLPNYQNNSCV